jgi:hypothetical protein
MRRYFIRMNYLHSRKAGESAFVKSKNSGETVDLHRRHETCIVRRLPRYSMSQYKCFPRRINGRCVRKEEEHALNPNEFRGCICRSHPKSIFFQRPSCDDPELNEVLGDNMELPAPLRQNSDRTVGGTIQRMMRLQGANQDARVYQHAPRQC